MTIKKVSATQKRMKLIFPNNNSKVKVERYSLTLEHDFILGENHDFEIRISPHTAMRVDSMVMNAPCPNFIFIRAVAAANIIVADGTFDAHTFNPSIAQKLSWPSMTPANRFKLWGYMRGFVPPGYINGGTFKFTTVLTGYAAIC